MFRRKCCLRPLASEPWLGDCVRRVLPCLLAGILIPAVPSVGAQPAVSGGAWTHVTTVPAGRVGAARRGQPSRGELFRLDRGGYQQRLRRAMRGEPSAVRSVGTEIELPMPDGTTARFAIVEAPVMAPELAAKFPEIKTYAGQGIDDPAATVRLDLSPAGVHAQILSPRGAVYVDPAYRGDAEHHVSYYKRDFRKAADGFRCATEGRGDVAAVGGEGSGGVPVNKVQSGATLRTFRLAVAATGEYTAYQSLPGTANVADAMAGIVAAVNRVNGIFETELAVRLMLVANNNLIVYTDGGTDPYTNDDAGAMTDENQANLDAVIGSPNYDIGHVFSTGINGVAILGCVCKPLLKAQGVTGSPQPTGDPFWIDFVAHEMGHQFGANHTFNGTNGFCGDDNREAASAYEPGSGSTIMAYAGICDGVTDDNLQLNSDPYFHAHSLDQIQNYISVHGGCATISGTGNTVPTVSAGTNYTIPKLTPFVLTATASDADGNMLSYCWEELDLGAASSLVEPDNGSSPLFRSFSPTNSPVRFFPKLSSVLANTNWNQEKLPATSRTNKFRVTVRDNRPGGGGVVDGDMQVVVTSNAGPFVVTSPGTAVTWFATNTVTWNVSGTAGVPVNAANVNLHLSTNGGLAFPILLATNTPNDGTQFIVLPNLFTTQARIRVQAAANIFYHVSSNNFTVLPANTSLVGSAWSNQVQLAWNTVAGPKYQVQYRTNLVVGGWQNFGGVRLGTGGALTTNDTTSGSAARFYRVLVSP